MILARACRWTAIALAAIAIADPGIPWPVRERQALRAITSPHGVASGPLVDRLRAAGFTIAADGESATVLTADAGVTPALSSTPIYVLDERAGGPDVSIVQTSASGMRVAGQAIAVPVAVHARGGAGATTTLHLEDGGLTVASATHRWSGDDETWEATLSYLPAGAGAMRLRVRADALPGELNVVNNIADLLAPAMRGPVRTLVVASDLTWPAVFVRRALEASPGFAVAAVQRTTKTIATRAGDPPRGLTRRDLEPYEVVVVGQPESLDAAAREALRWFVEARGGVTVFVPDRVPTAAARELLDGVSFDAKSLERPVALAGAGAGLMAADLAVPRALPPMAFVLAAEADGTPIVAGWRRGMGAVIVSGALDAWRYRDRNDAAFARFWPALVLQQAAAAPPLVDVTAAPSLARLGGVVRVTARLRATELPAEQDRVAVPAAALRVIDPVSPAESVVRLWPAAEPGVYEGEWRPAATGDYVVDASIGAATGAAIVKVAADVAGPSADLGALAIAARATGGAVVDDEAALVRALTDRFAASTVMRASHPARSIGYAAAFALLLSAEWALRRRRGLA